MALQYVQAGQQIICEGGTYELTEGIKVEEGIDGTAEQRIYLLADSDDADYKTGVNIVLKALEEPVRQIAANAGEEGSVIVDKIKNSEAGTGCNFATGEYVDMIENGIVDPAKVTRSALQNAASVAAMVLTTESLVTDIKDPQADAAQAAAMAAASQGGMY